MATTLFELLESLEHDTNLYLFHGTWKPLTIHEAFVHLMMQATRPIQDPEGEDQLLVQQRDFARKHLNSLVEWNRLQPGFSDEDAEKYAQGIRGEIRFWNEDGRLEQEPFYLVKEGDGELLEDASLFRSMAGREATFYILLHKKDAANVQHALHKLGVPVPAYALYDQLPYGYPDEYQERTLIARLDLSTIDEDLKPYTDDFGGGMRLKQFDFSDANKRLEKLEPLIRDIPGVIHLATKVAQ